MSKKNSALAKSALGIGAALLLVALAVATMANPGGRSAQPEPSSAIDFTLESIEGQEVNFAEATRDKAVVLKFGALWCGWCNKQSEDFQDLAKTMDAERSMIVEISIQNDFPVEQVKQRKAELGLDHTVLRDAEGKVAEAYKVSGIPAVLVIDPQGDVVYRAHYTPAERLQALLDQALEGAAEKPQTE